MKVQIGDNQSGDVVDLKNISLFERAERWFKREYKVTIVKPNKRKIKSKLIFPNQK